MSNLAVWQNGSSLKKLELFMILDAGHHQRVQVGPVMEMPTQPDKPGKLKWAISR
ncbi:MAG: hypothetical protein HGA37_10285 [Lentimicrobium sp.]|nr:hypothetical protein [Lentimicrobium sp.]